MPTNPATSYVYVTKQIFVPDHVFVFHLLGNGFNLSPYKLTFLPLIQHIKQCAPIHLVPVGKS